MAKYRGFIESPWDEVAIRYVLVAFHFTREQFGDAYKEQAALVKCVHPASTSNVAQISTSAFYTFFQKSDGWSLPTLLAILRDLRFLAYEVREIQCIGVTEG